jgi:hypothetical protein
MSTLTCAAALLALAPQTFTVDDDGPADFASIAAAIASPLVVDGDVLVVSPGSYASFTLDKALTLSAVAGTRFDTGNCTVQGVPGFAISGMRADTLHVEGVVGRGLVDDVHVGYQYFESGSGEILWFGRSRIVSCTDVQVTRSVLHGSDGCYPDVNSNHAGLQVIASTVAVSGCELVGGHEVPPWSTWCGFHPLFGWKAGLHASAGSAVTIAASTLRAGAGYLGFEEGGLHLVDSTARVVGAPLHEIAGPVAAVDGFNATAIVSGVTLSPPGAPTWVTTPAPPEPYLGTTAPGGPGTSFDVQLFGEPGGVAFAALSVTPALFSMPIGEAWLSPAGLAWSGIFPLLGQSTASATTLQVPPNPAFAGETAILQGLVLPGVLPGGLTNPTAIAVRG